MPLGVAASALPQLGVSPGGSGTTVVRRSRVTAQTSSQPISWKLSRPYFQPSTGLMPRADALQEHWLGPSKEEDLASENKKLVYMLNSAKQTIKKKDKQIKELRSKSYAVVEDNVQMRTSCSAAMREKEQTVSEVKQMHHELNRLRFEHTHVSSSDADVRKLSAEMDKQRVHHAREVSIREQVIQDLRRENEKLARENNALQTTVSKTSSELSDLQEFRGQVSHSHSNLQERYEKLREDARDVRLDNKQLRSDYDKLRAAHDQCQEWDGLTKKLLLRINKAQAEHHECEANIAKVRDDFSKLQVEHYYCSSKITQLAAECTVERNKTTATLGKLSALTIEYGDMSAVVKEKEGLRAGLQLALMELRDRQSALEVQHSQMTKAFNDLQSSEEHRHRLLNLASHLSKTLPTVVGLRVRQGPSEGLLVIEVIPGQPAALAEIHVNDVLLEVNGLPVQSTAAFKAIADGFLPGQMVSLLVVRDAVHHTCIITVAAEGCDMDTTNAVRRLAELEQEDFETLDILYQAKREKEEEEDRAKEMLRLQQEQDLQGDGDGYGSGGGSGEERGERVRNGSEYEQIGGALEVVTGEGHTAGGDGAGEGDEEEMVDNEQGAPTEQAETLLDSMLGL